MTELESSIRSLKESISVGNVLLDKLEREQKDLEKPKAPVFPGRFIAVPDDSISDNFVIGLDLPDTWCELPPGYKGRTAFDKEDIRQIIKGLQTLLGESNG